MQQLRELLHRRFRPSPAPARVGVELEWVALASNGTPAAIAGTPERPGTLDVLRSIAAWSSWREARCSKGLTIFAAGERGVISWEPGGQLEFSSVPHRSLSALAASVEEVSSMLTAAAADHGITLLSVGMDPCNGVEAAPMQLRHERYDRMASYFATLGPAGARMMRQSAALQLNIDCDDVHLGWRVANAMAPLLVAMFASSRRYAARDSGFASFRAENWRHVDPARTGLLPGDDPLAEYEAFALDAPAMLAGSPGTEYPAFRDLAATASAADCDAHLSTLFPDVRPRGHLELRSMDAVPPELVIAPLLLACGVLMIPHALRCAADLLGAPDEALYAAAAREGLRDAAIRRRCGELVEIAIGGAAALPCGAIDPAELERASHLLRSLARAPRAAVIGPEAAAGAAEAPRD